MCSISVIIPNYNNEKYLADCIDSVLNQSINNFEIIISDDNSNDNSRSIIEKYISKYQNKIRGIFNTKNIGVSLNRHNAILQAKGEYITTLDSDDFYFSDKKLESELNLIHEFKEKHFEDIIAFSRTVHVNEQKQLIEKDQKREKIRQGNIYKYILSRTCAIPRDFVMKKSIYFEVGGYDVKIPIFEDWDLKIRLASRYLFLYAGNHGTAYRHHGRGLSSINYKKKLYWFWKVFMKNRNVIKPQDSLYVWSFFLLRLFRIFFRGQLVKFPTALKLADKIVYGR